MNNNTNIIDKQPLLTDIPIGIPLNNYNICRCCKKEFEVTEYNEYNEYTAQYFRCERCNKNIISHALLYSCILS
jgi:hypothetical protein